MVHQIHKLLEQLKLIPGQNMEVQKLLLFFIGWNSMHLVWFPCISCMEFRPPWSDFHPLAWKSDSSIPAWCGSALCLFQAPPVLFTPDLDQNWDRFWQSSTNVQTKKNCFNSLFCWKTHSPNSQFCACFSLPCKALGGWRENSFYSFSFVAAAKPLFLFPAWLRQILLGSWTWMH